MIALPPTDPEYPLDPGIARFVQLLRAGGVETFESCQGGSGHCSADPFIRFHGQRSAGWRALCVAQEFGLPVLALQREWPIIDGEPTGPTWRLVFRHKDDTPTLD